MATMLGKSHIGIHGGVGVRTVDDVIAKTKISRIGGLQYFLNYGAPCARAELRYKNMSS